MYMLIIKLVQFSNINGIKKKNKKIVVKKKVLFLREEKIDQKH